MRGTLKQQAVNGAKWAAIEKFSLQGIQFLLSLVLAWLLTPDDYATIAMLTIFIAISNVFVDSGFSSALIRKLERTEDDYTTAFIVNFAISVFAYGILFIAAPFVGHFYKMPILCPILRVQAISLVLGALISVQVTKLTAELNFKALAGASLVSSILSGLIGIGLAYYGFGVWALVAQNLLSILFKLICLVWQCKWFPHGHFTRTSFNGLFSFGKNMLGANLLSAIYFNLDSLIIGRFFTASKLGNYNRGTHFAKVPVESINGVLNSVTYPILAKLQNDTERLLSAYRKYIKMVSMCIFFCCVLLAALGKPVVLFLLRDKWADAIIFLQIFSFAIMFDHLSVINLNLIKIKGKSDIILRLEVIKRILAFAILFAAIPFGVLGICISKVIYSIIAVVINSYYNGRLFGMGWLAQFKDYSPYLLYSIIACAPAYALTFVGLPNIVILLSGGLSAVLIYCFFLRKDACMIELVQMAMSRINRHKTKVDA